MRLGKVEFSLSYVVDLDDGEMVENASMMLMNDLNQLIKYEDYQDWKTCIDLVEDEEVSYEDIHPILKGEEE